MSASSEQRPQDLPTRPSGGVAPEADDRALIIAEDLAAVVEGQFSDPAAALAFITAKAGLMIAGPGPSTGGAMMNRSTAASKPQRGYSGFAIEAATYRNRKAEYLARHEGKFVVVVGEEILGPFDSFGEARWEGYERFGLGPLYVKQVLAEEPVVSTSRDI
jgi:hypothetical protein